MLWLLSKHLPSTASDHITGKQIPTQNSSFSCPEHSPRTLVCPALPAERSRQSLICQAGGLVEVLQIHALNNAVNIQGTWEFNTHVRQAGGFIGGRENSSNKTITSSHCVSQSHHITGNTMAPVPA